MIDGLSTWYGIYWATKSMLQTGAHIKGPAPARARYPACI